MATVAASTPDDPWLARRIQYRRIHYLYVPREWCIDCTAVRVGDDNGCTWVLDWTYNGCRDCSIISVHWLHHAPVARPDVGPVRYADVLSLYPERWTVGEPYLDARARRSPWWSCECVAIPCPPGTRRAVSGFASPRRASRQSALPAPLVAVVLAASEGEVPIAGCTPGLRFPARQRIRARTSCHTVRLEGVGCAFVSGVPWSPVELPLVNRAYMGSQEHGARLREYNRRNSGSAPGRHRPQLLTGSPVGPHELDSGRSIDHQRAPRSEVLGLEFPMTRASGDSSSVT